MNINDPQRHKVFTSFYHRDDQLYKNYIDIYLSDKIINKSVQEGEYNTENSDEYIKRLIRDDKISDSSVILVLVGKNTKNRKHVDWEISAGLARSINGSSGLVGIILPSVGIWDCSDLPKRLADNVESGYAKCYTWDYFIRHSDLIIEEAFNNRKSKEKLINNSRLQMKRNLGE